MTPRICTTKQAAQNMGFIGADGEPNTRAFLSWAKINNLLPIHGKNHHLWWDFKAIEQHLDNKGGDKPLSEDHDSIIFGRLAGGESARAIST